MKFAFYIARRYLISKKSMNVINIISGITIAGVCTGTIALVIVLSVMNGINQLIEVNFSSFDPDLKIEAVKGKSFRLSDADFEQVKQMEGVASFTEIIEENALLEYDKRMAAAVVKGVPDNYAEIIQLDSVNVPEGEFILRQPRHRFAVVGEGLAIQLSIGLGFIDAIKFYAVKKGKQNINVLNMNSALMHDYLFPKGIFSIIQDIDSRYIFVPYSFARDLFQMEDKISQLEIRVKEGTDIDQLQKKIEKIVGSDFKVKNQYQQHEAIYKVMKSEKWFIVLILGFILVVASFNILASLTMLIIDKKHDIAILQSMGASNRLIRRIFLLEGWMVSIVGAFIGIILGTFIAWLQMEFGLLKLPGAEGAYLMNSYPVQIQIFDLFLSYFLVCGIGFLASWYPVKYISGKYLSFS